MQKFAEVLSKYLDNKTVSLRRVADAINVDRTTLRRYVSGERLPKNMDIVEALAKEIGMSEKEGKRLAESYERSRIGEKTYKGCQFIEQIFWGKEPARLRKIPLADVCVDENCVCKPDRDIMYLDNRTEVLRKMLYICSGAAELKIMVHTEEMYRYIYRFIKDNKNCSVEQIVKLSNNNCEDDISDVENFANIYKLIRCGNSYKVHYIYDDYDRMVMHNCVISDKGMLAFDIFNDEDKNVVGMYTDKKDIVSYHKKSFMYLKDKSYVYGWCGTGGMPEEIYRKNILENKTSNVRIEIYDTGNQPEVWINSRCDEKEKCICIKEDTVVNLFKKYIENYG